MAMDSEEMWTFKISCEYKCAEQTEKKKYSSNYYHAMENVQFLNDVDYWV